jgi:hypothetical protein
MNHQNNDILRKIKHSYKESIRKLDITEILKDTDEQDYVTLYHGTTSAYLNNIIKTGILPRQQSRISNWKNNPSIENVTYLTNKWHYFYANSATIKYMDINYWWNTFETLPCYVECRIPKALLIADEDFIFTSYFFKKIKSAKNKNLDLTVNWMECLSQYGTVGVLGAIDPKYIVSFTVLGDVHLFAQNFMIQESQYLKDYEKWQEGKGKGKLKLQDLLNIEQQSDLNGTWWLDNFKNKELHINRFGINSVTGKLTLLTETNNTINQRYFKAIDEMMTKQYKNDKILLLNKTKSTV